MFELISVIYFNDTKAVSHRLYELWDFDSLQSDISHLKRLNRGRKMVFCIQYCLA